MGEHKRHIVRIHGDKPPYFDNPSYYDAIYKIATQLSEERAEAMVVYTKRNQPNDKLAEIVSQTREFADELARRLKDTKNYKRIEVNSETVPSILP